MKLLTVEETAALLRLKRNTLDQWRMKNEGPPFIKVGRLVMYPEQKLQDWLEARMQVEGVS